MKKDKKRYLRIVLYAALFALVFIKPVHAEPRLVTILTETGKLEVLSTRTLVADILAESNITLDADLDRVFPGLDQKIQSDWIIIEKGKRVGIKVDGRELKYISWAGTVGDLLAEAGISFEDDLINFPLEQRVSEGLAVEITRVDRTLVNEEVSIAAKTMYKSDATLALGKKKVQTQAKDGKKLITYEVIFHDGTEVSRRVVSETILVQPVAGVILKGTRSISRGSSDGVMEGIASYYGAELHGRRTASGVPFDMYALTAAHKTLPFGTRVKVTYLATGKSVVVEINDRGPYVPGRIIDLSAAAAKAIGLYANGIGKVRIEIIQ
jgi:rare lipoprotein A (peptidoglycan hydrolase)